LPIELQYVFRVPSVFRGYAHRKRLHTANVIERLFVEVRPRLRTTCAFTTRGSCEHILYGVFERMNTCWSQKPLKPF